jgi:hypothetical protein
VRHAEIDTPAKRCDCSLAIPPVDVPGTLPDYGNPVTGAAEFFLSQDFLATRPPAQTIMPFSSLRAQAEQSTFPREEAIHISA